MLRATESSKTSEAQLVPIRGSSFQQECTLVLRPGPEASLRVTLRSCDDPELRVSDYCINFIDDQTEVRAIRLCSENAGPDGVFRHLPPGSYTAEAVPRYSGAPAFYRVESPPKRVPIVLVDKQQSDLEFCVKLGGRISLLVKPEEESSSHERISATVEIAQPGGLQKKRVDFRKPDATGLTVGGSIPLVERQVSENVLDPGIYDLSISAKGFRPARKTVIVHAAQVTEIEIALERAP
ncbi:MAG TPA: carboxypeptidase-like regulatory domain-containing protein [Planctomycetota bacterium]|nr:carboxypeptidase-like regulatory domain-containing protein [Planctomycetota bacterium]